MSGARSGRLTAADVRSAHTKIKDFVRRTPCARSLAFDDVLSCRINFKAEHLQRVGAFKERGAVHRLLHLTEEERKRGVVTASAGNHAQALAYHATRLGIPSTVVMPETTPWVKVSNTQRYGGRAVLVGTTFHDALEEAVRLEAEDGLTMVHAFDDELVIAGQGTIGLEIVEQVPEVSVVVVPIGGGGLIAGIATAVKESHPHVRVIGVEAEAAPSARASRDAGRIVATDTCETIAEGIAVKRIGNKTFPIIEALVDDIVVVSEEEIATAILLLLEREKTLVEGAGAASLAAVLGGKIELTKDDVVVPVLCGSNIDITMLSRIIDRGLMRTGRIARLSVKVRDRPGALADLAQFVAAEGASVIQIVHRRGFADISVGDVEIAMHLETRGRSHVADITRGLTEQGYEVGEVH